MCILRISEVYSYQVLQLLLYIIYICSIQLCYKFLELYILEY